MAAFNTYPSNDIAKALCCPRDGVRTQLRILHALSGDLIGTVFVDPAWTVLRLKTEIANTFGIPAKEQRLLLDAATHVISDELILDKVLVHCESPSLSLLRSCSAQIPRAQQPITVDICDKVSRVTWVVDTKRLNTTVKSFVSPAFQLDFGSQPKTTEFKLMVYTNEASLKKAGGKGHLQLKCDGHVDENLLINVNIGNEANVLTSTDPFVHNFNERGVWRSSTASSQQIMNGCYDFAGAAGASSKLLVCLTIQPQDGCRSSRTHSQPLRQS